MANSYRDKKAHKARNPEKYFGPKKLGIIDWVDVLFEKGIYPSKDTPKIAWSIQGKRRRNSTRKGNQKVKQIINQIDRAKFKQETLKLIKESI